MDYLQRLAIQTGGKIRKQDLLDINYSEKSLKGLIIKDYKHYKIQINDFGSLCSIDIKTNAEIAFSINNPENILSFRTPIHQKSFPYIIYVSRSNINIAENKEFNKVCDSIGSLLKKINLTPEESVFVAGNVVCFALKTDRDLITNIDDIIDFFNVNQDFFKKTIRNVISTKNIPDSLKPLAPLMRKYSLSDDSERDQLIEEMKPKKIKQLIESVDPYMNDINNYLNSFKQEPLSEEATLLGNLAELVTELKINTAS